MTSVEVGLYLGAVKKLKVRRIRKAVANLREENVNSVLRYKERVPAQADALVGHPCSLHVAFEGLNFLGRNRQFRNKDRCHRKIVKFQDQQLWWRNSPSLPPWDPVPHLAPARMHQGCQDLRMLSPSLGMCVSLSTRKSSTNPFGEENFAQKNVSV